MNIFGLWITRTNYYEKSDKDYFTSLIIAFDPFKNLEIV